MIKQAKRQPAYQDTSTVVFGKHKGEQLSDVPARYLRWLWDDGLKDFSRDIKTEEEKLKTKSFILEKIMLANYIWNSQDAIAQEIGETFV